MFHRPPRHSTMDYQITTARPWRYRHPKRGHQALDPGTHRVPEDISDSLACLAIEQGVAVRVAAPAAAVAAPPYADPLKPDPKKPRRKPRVSPKNRSLGAAPENKLPLQ